MFSGVLLVLMPIISTVAGVKIYMYFRDHNPPHFHAKDNGDKEVFDIKGNSLRGGLSPKKSKRVRKWAKENEDFLKEEWNKHKK